VLYEVVAKRSSVIEGSLSIGELNDILDELANNMGKQYVLWVTSGESSSPSCLQRIAVQDFATGV
jgi:hypothetical protein